MKRMWFPLKETEKAQKGTAHSFLKGAAVLTAGVLAVKVMGAVFKIPLNWIIGEDGMGYFTTAYSFYSPIYSLATAGFPIAISRMVAVCQAKERYRDIRQIHRVSIPVFLFMGVLGFLTMVLGAGWYVRAMGNENAWPAMMALAPAILFSCLSAIYRGYYEGLRNMVPTALSEILEALCRLVLGLGVSGWILYRGMEEYGISGKVLGKAVYDQSEARAQLLPWAAAGAIAGVTAGSIVSFLFLLIRHRTRGDGIGKRELAQSPTPKTPFGTAVTLLKTAAPIGLGAVAVNLSGLVDATFLQSRIREILSTQGMVLVSQYQGMIPEYNLQNPETIPNFLFGCYANAHTLFMLIPALTQALGISALPSVAAAWSCASQRRLQRSVESVLCMTAVCSLPAGIGMAVLAEPIVGLLYGSRAAAPIVARLLPLMAAGAVFASASTPLQSMLQAVGRADIPVKLLGVGLLVKTALTCWLTGIPQWNIAGAAVGTLACYLLIMVGAFVSLCRVSKVKPRMGKVLFRPLAAAALCGAGAYFAQQLGNSFFPGRKWVVLISIGCGAVLYGAALFGLGVLQKEEAARIPGGQKILKILEKSKGIE